MFQLTVTIGLAVLVGAVEGQTPHIAYMFPGIVEQEQMSMQEPCDDPSLRRDYDFIIVGGGLAGCVLANRLTEEPDWQVLLLEAGGEETSIMGVPIFIGQSLVTDANWQYKTVRLNDSRMTAMNNQQMGYPIGHVLGGGSTINYMLYVRGNKRDYDNWESLGNTGWNYRSMLHYMKKSENMQIPQLKNSIYHSSRGNIFISYPPAKRSSMSYTIIQAAEELGEVDLDYNGAQQIGVGRIQTLTGNGSRCSANRGYLRPIRNRMNLHVKKRSLVTKILINPDTKTAYGVEFVKDGQKFHALARKEIIISAGAVKSPQLLMLSGIGPKSHLQEHNIPLIKDLNVGGNFMDHPGFFGVIFILNSTKGGSDVLSDPNSYIQYYSNHSGPLTGLGSSEVLGFEELQGTKCYDKGWPCAEISYHSSSSIINKYYASSQGISDETYDEFLKPIQNASTFQPIPIVLRPKSKGRITLVNTDISTQPNINPNMLGEEDDVEVMVAAVKRMIQLSQTKTFQKLGAKLHDIPLPTCKNFTFATDEYWGCAVRAISKSIFHPCGTNKMGPRNDSSSVVDPRLKVIGVKSLRVIDASIIPEITAGHLSAPTYAIAEKGADMIKAYHGRS